VTGEQRLGDILRLARRADLYVPHLIEAVAEAPGLADDVLRVANSPLYGMENRIVGLDRVALILGVGALAEIATAVVVTRSLRYPESGPPRGASRWHHALEIGLAAERIGRTIEQPALASQGFVLGMLHGPGASDVLESCGLPRTLLEALRGSADPGTAPPAARPLAALVHGAHAVIGGARAGRCDPPAAACEASLRDLGVDPGDAHEIRALTRPRFKEAVRVLGSL
jgi:HD-like signal output (HDOD) protein